MEEGIIHNRTRGGGGGGQDPQAPPPPLPFIDRINTPYDAMFWKVVTSKAVL